MNLELRFSQVKKHCFSFQGRFSLNQGIKPVNGVFRNRAMGFSILEVLVAASILVFAITSIYVSHLTMLRQISLMGHSSIINDNLIQRMEQLQGLTWTNLTDPAYLSTVLATAIPSTSQNVPDMTEEKLSVSAISVPYMPPAPSPLPAAAALPSPFAVTRTGSSLPVISPAGATGEAMLKVYAVKVTASASWRDTSGRTHSREISTILGRAGMAH